MTVRLAIAVAFAARRARAVGELHEEGRRVAAAHADVRMARLRVVAADAARGAVEAERGHRRVGRRELERDELPPARRVERAAARAMRAPRARGGARRRRRRRSRCRALRARAGRPPAELALARRVDAPGAVVERAEVVVVREPHAAGRARRVGEARLRARSVAELLRAAKPSVAAPRATAAVVADVAPRLHGAAVGNSRNAAPPAGGAHA